MIKLYRKKPVEVQACEITHYNIDEIKEFCETAEIHYFKTLKNTQVRCIPEEGWNNITVIIPTLEGDHTAHKGDFIIKGVAGEFYPCKAHIFEKTYELVEKCSK